MSEPAAADPPSPDSEHPQTQQNHHGPAPKLLVSGYEPEKNDDSPFKRPFLSMDLQELAEKLFDPHSSYVPRFEETERRIRGRINGVFVFDTTKARLVWEHKWFPQYWVPASSLTKSAILSDAKRNSIIPASVPAELSDLFIINPTTNEIRTVQALVATQGPLAGYAKFNFGDLDEWLEEQSAMQFHPRDPYHRVDILPSGRHIRVEIDGVVLANTLEEGGVMSLWETHFPGRWYLPRTTVNFEYLQPSATTTGCPYKGRASYYHAHLPGGKKVEDVVWWYESPLPESTKVQGMLCFYPQKVDMWIDDVKVESD